MLGLLLLLILVFMIASFAARASARRRALEEERRAELARLAEHRGEDAQSDPAASPFAGLPFGGLFEQLMTGSSGWSHSLAFDPETGRWVDISDEHPDDSVGRPTASRLPT